MFTHIVNGAPFLMYPRFILVFLNKQLDGVPKPPHFLPAVTLPSKVFTFMAKRSAKFSGRNTPLTAHMLEVAQVVAAAEQESSSGGEGSSREGTASQSTASQPVPSQHTQGTDPAPSPSHQDAAPSPQQDPSTQSSHHSLRREASDSPQASASHPNDFTPTDGNQTSGGDEGVMDIYSLSRELRRLKKVTQDQALEIKDLRKKFKRLHRFVWPLVKHHRLWVKSQRKAGRQSVKVSKSRK